jgi:hypothetical protein
MKRFITLATVLLVGLASVQAAQTDDQQKKKKKKQAQNHDAGDTRAKERRDADKQSARQHADD